MSKPQPMNLLDPLKVFVEYDNQYEIYVAQCLQTGHLVTADDAEMAKEMITELLEDEVSLAFQGENLSDLLSNPAPMGLWAKWAMAAIKKSNLDERVIRVHGEVNKDLKLLLGQAEVQTEVKIATGRVPRAA